MAVTHQIKIFIEQMGYACTKGTTNKSNVHYHYKLGNVLGAGSFGEVRDCTKRSTKQVFAVKIMEKDPPKDKKISNHVNYSSMFYNETSILETLNHPNVIRLHESFEDKKYLYAILDKCEGGELFSHIVKESRFAESNIIDLCRQMLQAIAYVHSCGIVHRDIKAENFLFYDRYSTSRLILIDFGMSTRLPNNRYLKQLCGSPHYVAPEIIKRNYRFQVDMWALGVVVFLMFFGKYPFEGSNQKMIINAILYGKANYPSSGRTPPISNLAMSFLNGLFEKDPEARLTPKQALNHPWLSCNNIEERRSEDSPATMVATVK